MCWVSRAICFTISPWSVRGLGEMPHVARQLGVDRIGIVPDCYVSAAQGELWCHEVRELVGGEPFSCRASCTTIQGWLQPNSRSSTSTSPPP